MEKEPNLGKDFPLELRIIEARTRWLSEATRSWIALAVTVGSVTAMTAAAALALIHGEYGYLSTVWSLVAMPIGAVLGHYFGRSNQDEEVDN
ncbi:MAG: hypothetical protein GKR98_01775 [Boseongicola sp.]|nr:MAG: hypothetical protein GKR98_01775 [Boseongicola sp.]